MATCDPLCLDAEETVFATNNEQQTEPLDLCVAARENAPILVGYYPEFVDCGKFSDDDEDVIFIKEYQEKTIKRCKKLTCKETPRRNPTRRARSNKHFQEFANGNFQGIDFIDDEDDMENIPNDGEELFSTRQEDSEEWNMENMLKKNRQKRRRGPYRFNRLGRRKKNCINNKIDEKKIRYSELETLLESNLIMLKDYMPTLKQSKNENFKRNSLDIVKSQVMLLSYMTEKVVDFV